MKVKDLPEDGPLDSVRIRLPRKALKQFREYAGGEPVMYCAGGVGGYGFMMTPDPPGSKERRLYPLPPGILTSDILEWSVA
jgi:hypothetical protein